MVVLSLLWFLSQSQVKGRARRRIVLVRHAQTRFREVASELLR